MAETGDHAFSHGLAVLADPAAAEDVALVAVRRGGRSRVATLAFSRYLALERVTEAPPRPPTGPVSTVVELAVALAATRPALERVLVDLAGRHGLDRAGLGRALGLPPAAAAERAAAVADAWSRELDPALVAWLGPGDCPDLAAILAGSGLAPEEPAGEPEGETEDGAEPVAVPVPAADQPSVEAVLAASSAVGSHVQGCEVCGDRIRSMVSVPVLFGSRPLDQAPPAVRAASRRNRFRPPAPLPAPIDPGSRRPWRRLVPVGVAALVVAGLAAGAYGLAHRASSRRDRVAVLTRVPGAGSGLTVSPKVIRAVDGAVLLRNSSAHSVHWHAGIAARWLEVTPNDGVLPAGGVVEIRTQVLAAAPEGDLEAPITVTGDDGSAVAAVVETTVEHPPNLAAFVERCTVTATADDEGAVGSVVLHWHEGRGERALAMTNAGSSTYEAVLREGVAKTTWWVTAVDSRGNRAQTAEQPAPDC